MSKELTPLDALVKIVDECRRQSLSKELKAPIPSGDYIEEQCCGYSIQKIIDSLKALDILKCYLYIDDENTLRLRNGTNLNLVGITFCERKVANLLKEVLVCD